VSDLDGATELGERLAYPNTPGEFAARWNSWTEERRISWLALATENSQIAIRCVMTHPESPDLSTGEKP